MIQVEYKIKIGRDEFTLKADVKDEQEFFEQMAFYSNLPRTAPNGSDDLKLVFRTTKKGHKYYSLISEKEQMEFKFGQNLEANGGGLFPKGWSPAYQSDGDQTSEDAQVTSSPPVTQAVQTQELVNQVIPRTPIQKKVTPAVVVPSQPIKQTITQTVGPATPSPQLANDVLSRFKINKTT